MGRLLVLLLAVLLGLQGFAFAEPDEHAARRAVVLGLLDSSAGLVLRSAEMQMRSGDANHRFRQESHLLYLTGENRPGLTLLLAPRGIQVGDTLVQVVLFVQKGSADGAPPLRPLPDGITADYRQFTEVLLALAPHLKTLYASSLSPGFVNDWLNNTPLFLERESRKAFEKKFPQVKVKKCRDACRAGKGDQESVGG